MSDNAHHSPLDILLGKTPKRARRHLLSLVFLTLAAVAVAVLLVRFLTGTDSPYYSTPVEVGNFVPLLAERGTIRGQKNITIKARLDGVVAAVPGPAKGTVRSGQVLARIDADPVRQSLEIARADLEAAQASLDAAQVSVQETASRLTRFESVWRRSNKRVPSLNELETARADASRARQEEAAAKARLDAARLRVQEGTGELKAAVVRAPFDGWVAARYAEPGRRVREGLPLFALTTGLDRLTITVPVGSSEVSQLKAGARASVRLEENPEAELSAKLERIETGAGGRRAVFALEQPGNRVMPGSSASLEIELPERSDVLLVPNSALEFAPEGTVGRDRDRIYLLSDDGEPRRVYVTVGGSDGRRTEIFAKGVEPGMQVITGWRDAPAQDGEPK
ncbi:efflux RND transporter periplasmic adaptor subunit [Novosphingobium pentaromativorans]|uniref:RND family efflux transporter MFP subunit n=1 Tax=Novosphingobium pentaromativorans US6-1 TaxID=1088721 RepID=G6EB66_9SPHN|nr:efflux RND transporter periplasmic adaptor subunit [Novosphingobium pentaromativorans]AIT80484.1 RND transporter [Novosphingobium pentaromativorans US6-1]EHJ61425.1 RND family efflux transporter MFP subunit [Novosphingobium pentaromativorans US6-1]